MPQKVYDPLAFVPSPEAVRERLRQAETLVERLRILLDLAERLQRPSATADRVPTTGDKPKGADRG
jgi:hypothetical protein